MVLRSLSYCRFSGTVRSDRGIASHPAIACSRGLCCSDWCAGGGVVSHDPAVLQLNNAAAVRSISLRMRDLNNRRSRIVQSLEKLHDFVALRGMQISSRLIRKDQLRTENHRASHAHKLLLAARELVWEKVFLAHDVEAIERVANQAHPLFVRHILVGERNLEILEHRQIVDQVIALK